MFWTKQRALLILPIALLASCQDAMKRTAEQPLGRFQIVTTQTQTLKIDTTSGQTWFLDADVGWKLLPDSPVAAAESGPYNTYLVVAKKPDLSLLKSQRPPLVDERIRSIPDVVSVELIKSIELIKPK